MTKARFEAMTEEELHEDKLRTYRIFRNQMLEQSDQYMNQIDRYTTEQLYEIKTYRQQLRDYINIHIIDRETKSIPPDLPSLPSFLAPNVNSVNVVKETK
jgi:hypothetical protein